MTTSGAAFDHALADRYRPEAGDVVEMLIEHRNGNGTFEAGSRGVVTEILGGANVSVKSLDGRGGWNSHVSSRCVCREDASRLPTAGESVVMLQNFKGLAAGEIADVVEVRQAMGTLLDLVVVGRKGGLRRVVFAGRTSTPLVRTGEQMERIEAPSGSRIALRLPVRFSHGVLASGKVGTVSGDISILGGTLKDIAFDDGQSAWVDPLLLALA